MNLTTYLQGSHPKDSESLNKQVTVYGFPITVERPRGSMRTLHDADGNIVYQRRMFYDYGFFNGSKGRDGDEVDVFLGPSQRATEVYVVHMVDKGPIVDQREDEDKVMLGFDTAEMARSAFLLHYPASFYDSMTSMSLATFREKLATAALPYRRKKITAQCPVNAECGTTCTSCMKAKVQACPKCGSKEHGGLKAPDFEMVECKACGKVYELRASGSKRQNYISRKIKLLIDEGYPHEQAVAIAHKYAEERGL